MSLRGANMAGVIAHGRLAWDEDRKQASAAAAAAAGSGIEKLFRLKVFVDCQSS